MARLQSYPVDGTIDDLDIVIGSDGAVGENYATKNYTVGGLKTHITAGFATEAYVDQAETDAVATANAYTDVEVAALLKQTILGSTDQIRVGDLLDVPPGEVATVTFKPVTGDASTGSLNFNASNNTIGIEEALGEITNTSIADVTLRISITAFSSISQNNSTIDYILQYYNGVSWNDLKLVERTKSSPGSYADSFWSYFKLPPAHKFRIGFRANKEGVILDEFSQIEFEVK